MHNIFRSKNQTPEDNIFNQYSSETGMISYPVGVGKTMKIDHNGVRMFASGLAEVMTNEIRGTQLYLSLNNESNLESLENLVSKTVSQIPNDQCLSVPVSSSVLSNTSIDALQNVAGYTSTRNEPTVFPKYTDISNNEAGLNVTAIAINPRTPESGFYDETGSTTASQTQVQRCAPNLQQMQNQQQYKLVSN